MTTYTSRLLAGVLAASLIAASNLPAQSAYFVTVTDMRKNNTYEVLSREDLKTLQERLKLETRHFPAALAAAKKAWEADAMNKGIPFPGSGISPRKMRMEGPFKEELARKKAEKKTERDMEKDFENAGATQGAAKNKLTDKEIEKLERKASKEAQIDAAADLVGKELERLLGGNPAAGDAAAKEEG